LKDGDIDLADLRAKADEHARDLAALMVTYPSTHGVFEPTIREICDIVHAHGGQVYMDGANMNAQVGLCRPAITAPIVCHLNLHKTFCIPHGGGGRVWTIGVAKHLAPYLPREFILDPRRSNLFGEGEHGNVREWSSITARRGKGGNVSAALRQRQHSDDHMDVHPHDGREGLKRASEVAILNANYIAKRLDPIFPFFSKANADSLRMSASSIFANGKAQDRSGRCSKALDGYGFHAPTVSWPVAGTMMIEPPRANLNTSSIVSATR
jgi:glycine dehydrogenase